MLMLASNNILSPATGEPIITPSQDMVLGSYYLTALQPGVSKPDFGDRSCTFAGLEDVIYASKTTGSVCTTGCGSASTVKFRTMKSWMRPARANPSAMEHASKSGATAATVSMKTVP